MLLSQVLEKYMPDEGTVRELVDFFGIFSHETRIRILNLLSISEFCVNDIVFALKLNQTTVSHQLKTLRDARVIDCKRDGKRIIYFMTNDKINDLFSVALQASEQCSFHDTFEQFA